jgi:glucosylceramidase
VVPGAHPIDSNSFGSGGIEDVTFQNPDGTLVLPVLNSGNGGTFPVNWRGQSFNYSLPAGAVATFQWKP